MIKKFQISHSTASDKKSSPNQGNVTPIQPQTITIAKSSVQARFSYASHMRLLRKNISSLQPAPSPHTAIPTTHEAVEFPHQKITDADQLTFRIKMTALFKVFYKTQLYRVLSISIHIIYMFGVLIEMPEQVCTSTIQQKFRCNLSYYIQIVCLAIIVLLTIIKKLRLVKIDFFRLIVQIVSFGSGVLALTGPGSILKYAKALRCLRLLLVVRETSLIVPSYNMVTSLKSIRKILFPAILFVYIYAIIGLYSFSDNEYSRCRDPRVLEMGSNWTAYEKAMYLCGQRSCPSENGVEYECLNPIDFNVQPEEKEFSKIQFGSGLLKYSNILMALMITYKQILITGSSRIILLQKQAMNYIFVLVYYYSFIYLLSYIYLNIFYGLMIVNRQNHISTKQEYDALTDKENQCKMSKLQRQLMRKYERVLKKFNKNIFFPVSVLMNSQYDKTPIYQTVKSLSHQSFVQQKRSGIKLDPVAVNEAAVEHQVSKQIIKIAQLKVEKGNTIKEQLQSCSFKLTNALKIAYYYFNIAVVILGCVNVSMEHAGQSQEWQRVMNLLDLLFFLLYLIDFLGRYLLIVSSIDRQQKQLLFQIPQIIYIDGLILSVCMTGYLYEIMISDDFTYFYFAQTKIQKCFRAMLYLRIIVLLSFEPYFAQSRKLFLFAWQAVKKSANFMLLWFLVLIMFSLMAYFLFGNCNTHQGCYLNSQTQNNYQGIFQSIITATVIMYNQDWHYIMYEQFPEHGYFIVLWNLIITTFGILIISKYFMTYLLSELDIRINQNFDKQNEQKVEQKSFHQKLLRQTIDQSKSADSEHEIGEKENINKLQTRISKEKIFFSDSRGVQQSKQKKDVQKRVTFNSVMKEGKSEMKINKPTFNPNKMNFRQLKTQKTVSNSIIFGVSPESNQKPLRFYGSSEKEVIEQIGFKQIGSKDKKIYSEIKDKPIQTSKQPQTQQPFVAYYPKSRIYMVVKSLAIITVVLNFIFYRPQSDPNLLINKVAYYVSVVVDSFFIIDMVGQLYVFGIIKFIKKASVSRWIDLILNIISIAYFTPFGSHYIVKRFYCFRCLRICYWINIRCQKNLSMRVTVKGFTRLIPKILNLLLVVCIVYGFFANIIVRIYKDEMWQCVDYDITKHIKSKIDCFNYGGDWVEENMNASNFGNALLYIFLLASTEDWLDTMNYLSTIQGQDLQPQSSYSSFLRIFFLIFMFFANIIVINIFVGVCINNFKQIKKKVTGEADLSKDEKEWLNLKNQIYLLEPEPMDQEPANEISKFFFKISKSNKIIVFKFIQFLGLLILFSFVVTNMSRENKKKILLGQFIFTFCGFITFLIELIANGFKKNNRTIRIFECIVYLYALFYGLSIMATNFSNSVHKICEGILVTLQLSRYFLFIQEFEFFQKIFNSLMTILPKTKDIFMLMIVTLFIYTCIGIEIFGYLKPGQELNQFDQNYVNFGNALFSLIKFSTWEEPINQIRDGIQRMTSRSVCFQVNDYASFLYYGQNGCGNKGLALTFFITFHIIYSLILTPTLMAIIFDSYNEVYIDESACINKFHLIKIKEEWKKFDPQGAGYISYRDFWVLTSQIIKIYNFAHKKLLNNETRQNFLKELNISIYESPEGILCLQFHELIEALTRIILMKKKKNIIRKDIFNNKVTYIDGVNKKSEVLHKLKKSSYDSSHVLTLIFLKSGLRSWRNKTGLNKGSLFETIEIKNNKNK